MEIVETCVALTAAHHPHMVRPGSLASLSNDFCAREAATRRCQYVAGVVRVQYTTFESAGLTLAEAP